MARRVMVIAAVLVSAAIGLFAVFETYFYFTVLKPGVEKMIEAAERGDPAMQTDLGALYQAGGIPRRVTQRPTYVARILADPKKAVFWYRKAAAQGYAEAEMFLAWAYADGSGVPRDDVQVARWMRQSAEHGSAEGQMLLGRMLDKGYNGVVRDAVQAVRWYRAAANSGQVQAQTLLGDCYAAGRGVPRDDRQAVEWYTKASDQGDVEARERLREMQAKGRDVVR